MKELTRGILLIFGLIFILSIIDGMGNADAVTLLNTSNSNSTANNDTSILNSTSHNATLPNTIGSILEDNETGSIASLPAKCLGSALCPD